MSSSSPQDAAPVFHKPLRDISTSQGECVVLECRVKGQPPPSITWKREGDVIEDCPDFRMLHRGEVATLVIGEAFPEDTGIFTCEAINQAGSSYTSCKLVVKGRGYHSISTKSAAAASSSYHHPRPTQVLPAQRDTQCIESSSCAESSSFSSVTSSNYTSKTERQISQLTVTPKRPRYYVIDTSASTSSSAKKVENSQQVVTTAGQTIKPDIDITSSSPKSSPPLRHHINEQAHISANGSTTSSNAKSPAASAMATAVYHSPQSSHSSDETHNFKTEKDQVIAEVAQNAAVPKQQERQRKVNRELAIIERDIELRHAMSLSSPMSPTRLIPQEYKISTFEQRLMNEIEYRLERTPPVNEDPEDAIFEEVPEAEQTTPGFTSTLKNFKAMDGTSAKFVCRVSGKPKPKIYWFKDGKQISKRSQHYLQRTDDEGGYELHIPHLCMEDDGNYTALAANPQGSVSSTGRLAMISERGASVNNGVNSPSLVKPSSPVTSMMSPRSAGAPSYGVTSPRLTSTKVLTATSPVEFTYKAPVKGELAVDEESPVERYYRPTFIQKPSAETRSEEGKLVRFDVKVTGLPIPNLEWLINGRPVRQDALHKILVRENNVHSLLLERVSPMDEGQYTITAKNKAGTATTHVQLHVTPREQLTAPVFIQRLSAQCVAEGDSVRLEARVIGSPRPIICWKQGSDQVMHDNRTQLYQDDSGYVCLQITQAKLSDAAWYTCSASSKAGISSCNCKLDVYSPTAGEQPTNRRRIRTPHRYANLAKVAGIDMREAISPDAQGQSQYLPESDEL
ncbi:myopalladin-like isoform X1 [Clavelina lepadiformis]|uniref:myopalladin-like isoform X1 n=1 Tax=Clavelina lepadiformis TaxID=159417 RepID=UPI0040418ED0